MIDNRTVREITGGGTYITTVYLLKLKREHCGGIDCTVECQVLEKVEEEVLKVYSSSVKWPNEEKTHHHHWISILS